MTESPSMPYSDIHWQCRRGMLELDLLLNNFVDNALDDLSETERTTLETLLSYPDQTLLDLLLGNTVSRDSRIAGLIDRIRATPFADAG